ncbi:uncharacterized protein LOC135148515 [Daucus carota subsp. sativus]|uniref:uncharacterized protein LOC135148515 n=1 Tax=Daucus carota subsp. sativus TaxID=79200 RepID=UPI0030836D5B
MRGRLRSSQNKSEGANEGDVSLLPNGKEILDYEDTTGYVGGKIAYFDMCSVMDLNLLEMEAMIAEVGIVGEKVDLWLFVSSNMPAYSGEQWDSSESDCPKLKKKPRRIPPPNPPYRARKRGRYSMLRGLYKNTPETPVIIDGDEEMVEVEKKVEEKCPDKGKKKQIEEDYPDKGKKKQVEEEPVAKSKRKKCKSVAKSKGKRKEKTVEDVQVEEKDQPAKEDVQDVHEESPVEEKEQPANEENVENVQDAVQSPVEENLEENLEEDFEENFEDANANADEGVKKEVKDGSDEEYDPDDASESSQSTYDSEVERMTISSCDEQGEKIP